MDSIPDRKGNYVDKTMANSWQRAEMFKELYYHLKIQRLNGAYTAAGKVIVKIPVGNAFKLIVFLCQEILGDRPKVIPKAHKLCFFRPILLKPPKRLRIVPFDIQ